jgi:phosphoglycolate phosphatase-like HAD superfamily hydrolase
MTDIIFDLDGTLADCEHRRGFIASKPKNWKAFFEGMSLDPRIEPVVDVLLRFLRNMYDHNRIILCSGRPDNYRKATIEWLQKEYIPYNALYMRAEKDSRPDDIVKEELLAKMREDGYNPTIAFDDRKKVCEMWVRNGLFVFDVAQGKGDF